jgi:hypothetical protein
MPRTALIPLVVLSFVAAGCSTTSWMPSMDFGSPAPPPPPPPTASAPPAPGIAMEDLVGRWGLASYHKETDRARTMTAARGQCNHAYNITRGPNGGVMMHLADAPQPIELRTKGGPDGKRFIGPDGPIGDPGDREIVTFDGRVMMLRFIDPEVAGRYGTMVYVRCAPRAGARV